MVRTKSTISQKLKKSRELKNQFQKIGQLMGRKKNAEDSKNFEPPYLKK